MSRKIYVNNKFKYMVKKAFQNKEISEFKEKAQKNYQVKISIQKCDVENVLVDGKVHFEFITNINSVARNADYVKVPKETLVKKMNSESFIHYLKKVTKANQEGGFSEGKIAEIKSLAENQTKDSLERILCVSSIEESLLKVIEAVHKERK